MPIQFDEEDGGMLLRLHVRVGRCAWLDNE